MKLTGIFFMIGLTASYASVYSQQTKLHMSVQNMSVKDILKQIEEKSEFSFMYNASKIDIYREIDLNVEKSSIEEILKEIFTGEDVSFKIIDRHILISSNLDLKDFNEINYTQQLSSVSGKVTDSSGTPLAGVSVVIKGTTQGTVTNTVGEYFIANIPKDAMLVFSFVGMETQEIKVGLLTKINVTLLESAVGLDEVVVIGYGTAKKSDLTGSVIRVKGEDFQTQSLVQVSDMLAGTVAGFFANQSTSAAGGSSMEIRGPTSLSAGTSPLIVLDGVIFNGSIRDINPNDIESIDILKDASSAAIYGSKAASGVVIITTTKGRIGKPTIGFSTKIGMTEAASDYRPLDGEKYLQFRGDYLRSLSDFSLPRYYFTRSDQLPDGVSIEEWRSYNSNPNPDNTIEYLNRHKLQTTEVEQYMAGISTDWYDMVVVRGLKQDYDLNIRGGTENITYYWSLGYLNNKGIIKGDKFSAIRSRINVNFKVTEWLNAGINMQYSDRDEGSTPASLYRIYRISPWGRPYNENGSPIILPQDLFTAEHPLMEYFGTDRDRKINSLFSSIYAEVTLPLMIKYRLSFQPRNSWLRDYNFYGDLHTKGYADHVDGYGTRSESSNFEWMVDNLLKWNKEFGLHNFDLTLLYSSEQLNSWSTDITNETFTPNLYLGYHALQFGSKPTLSNYDTEARGDALMARINYTLAGKYLLTASIRRDGYSAFGQENPRAFFPAAAFAWQISEEDFFKFSFINRMKLRLSWGANGNRDVGIYSALANLGSNLWYDGSKVMVGVYNSTLANSGLRWERTEAINVGLDMGLFENKIDLSLDYYDMTTTDLLMLRELPELTGFTSIMSNLGELGNKGFEMTINTININNQNLTWRSNLVFSLNRNKIKKLFGDKGTYTLLGEEHSGELPDFSNLWFPGQAIDVIWDYEILGVWQEDEAEEAAKYGLKPGDCKALDVDGDGEYININDKKFLGYERPRYRFGIKNDFNVLKNLTVSLFVRADLGHLGVFSPATQVSSEFDRFSMSGKPVPYWTPENPISDYPRLDFYTSREGIFGGGLQIYKPLSFIRIQDFSITYSLPETMTQKLHLNSMNIFGSVRNFYSFDKWPGFDPESGLYPMPRTFTMGLELTL